MNILDKNRKKLNKIDKKMALLFKNRMDLVKSIKEYKRLNNISIENKDRENEIINNNINYTNEYKEYYKDFMNNIFTISKSYQEDNKK